MNEGGNKNTVRDELRVLTCVYTVYIIVIILLFILLKLLFTAETVACMPNRLYILLENVRTLLELVNCPTQPTCIAHCVAHCVVS